MSTEDLIERLLGAPVEASSSMTEALHVLLDDSTIDPAAPNKTVSEAASLTRLSSHTLRYYEQEGLVRPSRNSSGHREYSPADLRRLIFLTRMRLSGMSIGNLKRYIALVEQGRGTEPERRQLMLAQRAEIQRRIRELTLALEATEFKIRTYGGHPDG